MQKTKIEWCDRTWNPVTGCLHGCPYCYAARQARRFCTNEFGKKRGLLEELHCTQGCQSCSEMGGAEFVGQKARIAIKGCQPFPFGFLPTLYTERMDEPKRLRKPSAIFTVSMHDLFGNWVPDEWIEQVLDACRAAPQHVYIFLTKNPKQYIDLASAGALPREDNFWFGSSVPTQNTNFWWATEGEYHSFISIEPMLGPFDQGSIPDGIQWVIVGAQTGPGAKQHQPKREWVDSIVNQCRAAEIPVFMKNSLEKICGVDLIQEYPEAITAHMTK